MRSTPLIGRIIRNILPPPSFTTTRRLRGSRSTISRKRTERVADIPGGDPGPLSPGRRDRGGADELREANISGLRRSCRTDVRPSSARSSSLGQKRSCQSSGRATGSSEARQRVLLVLRATGRITQVRAEPEIAHATPIPPVRDSRSNVWSLRSSVNEVAMFFSATDNGKSVSDLARSDVKILDDHKPPAAVSRFTASPICL